MRDLSNYLFRASSLKRLMSNPKSKKEKENGDFGLTAKEYLREVWIEENFGRKKDISSISMQKGTEQENPQAGEAGGGAARAGVGGGAGGVRAGGHRLGLRLQLPRLR